MSVDFRGLRAKARRSLTVPGSDWTLTRGEAEAVLALFLLKERLHVRAQRAESALAEARLYGVEFLVKKLDDLGHEGHLLRLENEYMKRERARLKERVAALETSGALPDGGGSSNG